jgi:hypothetical protein
MRGNEIIEVPDRSTVDTPNNKRDFSWRPTIFKIKLEMLKEVKKFNFDFNVT